ncbi:MAG: hypothetical protein KDA44_18230 [Planctomycetales bacterium]|nr:hypothetical protein [Planctomycetales bacterium]
MLFAIGCNAGDGNPELSKVTGQVTFQGNPAAGAVISFYSQQAAADATLIPQATVADDGSFELVTRDGVGAPPGEYKVTVVWYEPIPEGVNSEMYSPRDRLRNRYADPEKSGLTATITGEPTNLPPFELQ